MVIPNGNVIVSWAIPADPFHEFQSYEVFYSSSQAGPYTNIASQTTYSINSYSSMGLNANLQSYYFYVQVKNTLGQLIPAVDTVKTITLIMNSPSNSSIAFFQWNDFHTPLPAGETGPYKIFREYPQNQWTQIATVPVHNSTGPYYFHDTISVCYDSINYRVELFDPVISCTSVSNIKGAYFEDKNPPAAPMLDSVSVDLNGNVVMGINPSSSPDATCFVVYQWSGVTYFPIDTSCTGNTPTIYTYTNSSANSQSQEFSVAAIDSCGNISVIALNNQATIYLRSASDICSKTASLSWNAYKNMNGGVSHYEILCSVNGGTYHHVADTTALTYIHKNLVQGNAYCYRIRAHSVLKNLAGRDSITSTSNKSCTSLPSGSQPSFVYLSNVSVNNPAEDAGIKWLIDPTVKVGSFNVLRADNHSGPFSGVGFTSAVAGQSAYSFSDHSADATKQKYYYCVRVLDTCNTPIMRTDTSNTIFLVATASGKFGASLNWNDYAKWLGNVSGYNIYRSLNGTFSGVPIASVPFGTTTYIDDLSNYTMYEGKFTYYVEAIEGTGDPYGLTEKSQSNYADVYLDAMMFIPNAFFPQGHNKVFLPVGDYVDISEYKLSIFDRWGGKIYETGDENRGWDGGSYPEGLYGYKVEYKNAMGEYRQQQGTVTLIR
jgi:hypothetical protein